MRRTLHSLIIAVFALTSVAVIVGTGFAFWSFSSERRADVKVGVYINEATANGIFYGQKIPSYAVLEEGGGSGVNGTVTGITFYNTGAFYKDGEDVALDGSDGGVLYDTAIEINFKTVEPMGIADADSLIFGIKLAVQDGVLSEYMRTSIWYNSLQRVTDAETSEEYIDLKKLVLGLNQVVAGKSNFEYGQNDDGTMNYTFRLTTTTLSMCFEYISSLIPENADAYNALVEKVKRDAGSSKIVVTLWQGTNQEAV